ncbi:hypothetical protein EPI10_006948 [Gossypium australe]|uniref:Uncharacterized protein n=1 Tax=Gossypium australe TaxID=47621 RepID=A0A5B6WUY6_9ROSI|nr:hypothetical protein EPI10_006948 [Gossypium australe]
MLNVKSSSNPKKYLGLPNMVAWEKKLAFQVLKDRMKQELPIGVLSSYRKVLFLHVLWLVFYCLNRYVPRWKAFAHLFGSKRVMESGGFIGVLRDRFVP